MGGDVPARSLGVSGDRGRAEAGRGSELREHRDEPDAEVAALGLFGGVAGHEPDGGLGAGVAAAQRGAAQGGAAGQRDHGAAGVERGQQCLADPVEYVLHVDLPAAAERLPGVVLDRAGQRSGAGVEHQDAGPDRVDELPCDTGVGRVRGYRDERVAELGVQLAEAVAITRDSGDRGACLNQRDNGRAAEPSAGAGDESVRS
jgi:hypothetical protein